jgi:hypothetical protein
MEELACRLSRHSLQHTIRRLGIYLRQFIHANGGLVHSKGLFQCGPSKRDLKDGVWTARIVVWKSWIDKWIPNDHLLRVLLLGRALMPALAHQDAARQFAVVISTQTKQNVMKDELHRQRGQSCAGAG